MIRRDFHVHTTWCDGKDTAETVVRAAIAQGMTHIGFSGHSNTPHDQSYCMTHDATELYRREIAGLRRAYAGQIEICCGIELDATSDQRAEDFDYAIGSLHYIKVGAEFIPVDETPEILRDAARKHFGGDMLALVECYFRQETRVIEQTHADIIGHFDLITKFNEKEPLFDAEHPRYRDAALAACDELLRAGLPFEINTGAVTRGWRTAPYPAPFILEHIAERGGSVVLSSDSHSAGTLCAGFAECEKLCARLGLTIVDFLPKRGRS